MAFWAAQSGSSPHTVNIKDYGAIGDGVTDDTAAIQSAIDYINGLGGGTIPGTVLVPDGIYVIHPQVANLLWTTVSSNRKNYACLLVGSNTTIEGVGAGAVFKLGSTLADTGTTDGRGFYATSHMIVNRGAAGLPKTIVNNNIHVKGLTLDANWIQESGEGVTLCGVSNFSITNCYFKNSIYECSYMVYSRNGLWTENTVTTAGLPHTNPLNDGGGPMIDSCTGITISENHLTDIGYYAVLAMDSFQCSILNNVINRQTYDYSTGYQAIRCVNMKQSRINGNQIYQSGYSGIWVHKSEDCQVKDNVVLGCGYNTSGNSAHGIVLDSTADVVTGTGRHQVSGNYCTMNKSAGIAVLDAFLYNDFTAYNTGNTVSDNICSYNQRDGITVYGQFHSILGNKVESNGISVTDGIVGNGYSGIVLNGAKYCVVGNNTISDIPITGTKNLNLDASLVPNNTLTALSVNHASRTQNWGIAELPGFLRETKYSLVKAGVTVTGTTATDHGLTTDQWVLLSDFSNTSFSGYYQVTVTSPTTFTYDMTGAIPMPADGSYAGETYFSYVIVSDHNIITGNNISSNLNNPSLSPTAGGYRAFVNAAATCGANSIKANNLGQ